MDIPYNDKTHNPFEGTVYRNTAQNRSILRMRIAKMNNPKVLEKLGITAAQLHAMTPRQLKELIKQIPNVPMNVLDTFIEPFTMDQYGNLGISTEKFENDESEIISFILNSGTVRLDPDSAQCIHVYDGTQFAKAQAGTRYDVSMLYCLTPRGLLVNNLINGVDFIINSEGILSLNLTNVKPITFSLLRESPDDDPRITFAFSNYAHTIPFSSIDWVTEPLYVYVPQSQQDVVIPISYHSEYVDVQLPSVAASQLRYTNVIDPIKMIEQFAGDMRNVQLHANLQIPECPMEQLVSARVNFAHLTEPICSFLDGLFQITEQYDDSRLEKYAIKVPYIYSINMQTMTCTRRRMLQHDLGIPLMTPEEFAHYNRLTAIEDHLIRYTMFQMMLSYRKFTFDEFQTCPEHHITFDLYLRRGAGDVGYHYDLTPDTIASSVGLLYNMRHGHVKVGPQLIPRRYRTDREISDINVIPMSAFIQRNSAILFNNITFSHSTPNVENFISRMPYQAGYEVRDREHNRIYTARLNVTHDPITFPENIRNKLSESSVNPSRTFLRSWHIVHISPAQLENLAPTEDVLFSKGVPFHQMATETMRECFEWLRTAGCMCVEVATDAASGEIVPPSKLPGHLRGGRIMPSVSAAPNLQFVHPNVHPKVKSKTQYSSHRSKIASPIRAYTLSISHLKQQIGSKVKKIRAVLKNPKQNIVVMSGPMRTQRRRRAHSQSHSQKSPNKRSYTRKVRSAP